MAAALLAVGAALALGSLQHQDPAEYERAVVFRLGWLLPRRGPGRSCSLPFVDRMVRVDLQTITLTIRLQEVIYATTSPRGWRPCATSA